MTYSMGVGVDTTAFDGGPTEWTLIERDDDNPLAASVGDVPLVIVERNDEIHVLAGRCTHRGGPLSEGTIEGDCIVCPWHGSCFSYQDGSVRSGPAVAPQPSYEVRKTDDGLEVRRREARSLRVNPTRVPDHPGRPADESS
jgi:nitrite reductase/ring-hydroxylating ferredoxin subunit